MRAGLNVHEGRVTCAEVVRTRGAPVQLSPCEGSTAAGSGPARAEACRFTPPDIATVAPAVQALAKE